MINQILRALFTLRNVLCFIVAFSAANAEPVPAAHKPIVPLGPADLIRLLPKAPSEWTMTQSNGKSFFLEWLCSQASREFRGPPPPAPSTAGGKPALPPITRVRVMDTGYFPSFNGDFENFRIGKFGSAESLVVNGMPARKFVISASRERLRVSVRGRFIVEIEIENQLPNALQAWLQTIDFSRIANVPDSTPDQLPKPVTTNIVDELVPSKNSVSTVFWGGSAVDPKATEP